MSTFLKKHQRQVKLFVDLPSKGKFYNDEVLESGQHIEIPVYGMSAMDEILFKTPDALFSGQATAQVLQSCIPTIKDPWQIVGYDLDYLLIAIRMATYGNTIPITTACPNCTAITESEISLQTLLDNFQTYPVTNSFEMDSLTFNIKPLTYKQQSDFAVKGFQIERQILQIENSDVSKEEKDRMLNDLLLESTRLNLLIAVNHISSITNGEETEVNFEEILDFVENNDAVFYNNLKSSIFELTERWNIPKFDITCSDENCDTTYKSKMDLDYSNFFGPSSLRSRNLIS